VVEVTKSTEKIVLAPAAEVISARAPVEVAGV